MQELINKNFSEWTVVSYEGKINTNRLWYKVICSCGNESIVERNILKRGKSTRCRSCARKISTKGKKNSSYTHGYSSASHPFFKIYSAWCSMKSRCYRVKDKNYKRYGERGISVCDEWKNSFEAFLSDMGHPENGESLDRIDVNGNYCRDNCRWANKETQANNCRTNTYYEYNGEKLSETQWSRKLGISRNKTMWWLRKRGIEWVVENIEEIKEIKRGMSNSECEKFGLPNKRRTTLGVNLPDSNLKPTYNCYRGSKNNAKVALIGHEWGTFESFLSDMGVKPEGLRLLRKEKDKGFNKENCYWG
jgi:hypothetical protein